MGESERQTQSRIALEPSARRALSLLVIAEQGVMTFPLPPAGALTIGRAERCEIAIADALLSREHARIVVADAVALVDLDSSNGTRVDGQPIEPRRPVTIGPGAVISLGNSIVVLQPSMAEERPRQLWSHGYFASRLEEECARAAQRKSTFAVLRVRFAGGGTPTQLEARLSTTLGPEHVVGSYAPGEYEALLTDVAPEAAQQEAKRLEEELAASGSGAIVSIACFPRDGRTPEALIAHAGATRARSSEAPETLGVALTRLRPIAERFAAGTIPVLVLGETGVGKDVLARMIHQLSPRAAKPLVCLNCAALPETLLESELFGYERGAFTGATAAKAGLLESANGGTVFLDEVGEMPLAAQAKLLRVLDHGEVLRLGATRPRPIDARFVAATNRDLEHEVQRGRFREDLYFRLAAAAIVVPPLRERAAEIAPLAQAFVAEASMALGRATPPRILPEALALLERHSWPGNVRELRNAMERAVLLAGHGDIGVEQLAHDHMGRKLRRVAATSERRSPSAMPSAMPSALPPEGATARLPSIPSPPKAYDPRATTLTPATRSSAPPHLNARLPDLPKSDPEMARVLEVLEACDWNQTKAAIELKISRRTLVSRLSAYGLTRRRARD